MSWLEKRNEDKNVIMYKRIIKILAEQTKENTELLCLILEI